MPKPSQGNTSQHSINLVKHCLNDFFISLRPSFMLPRPCSSHTRISMIGVWSIWDSWRTMVEMVGGTDLWWWQRSDVMWKEWQGYQHRLNLKMLTTTINNMKNWTLTLLLGFFPHCFFPFLCEDPPAGATLGGSLLPVKSPDWRNAFVSCFHWL